jgi:hypothetical protein
MLNIETLLHGAYDIHVHSAPDILPRAQDGLALARDARQAGLAGIGIKDHTTSTVGYAYALNAMHPQDTHFYSALALNPSVGGLNPVAVEAALRNGADIIYMPTYAARFYRAQSGGGALAAYPSPDGDFSGLTVLDGDGALKPEVMAILDQIAAHDAVLGTGHLSPREVLTLLKGAQARGVRRMVVTHASEPVPGLTVEQQAEAVRYGAFIEHCLLALVGDHALAPEEIRDQIRHVGVEHAVVSSDFGQAANGPVVAAFAHYLDVLRRAGLTDDEVRAAIVDNPARLLLGRRGQSKRRFGWIPQNE